MLNVRRTAILTAVLTNEIGTASAYLQYPASVEKILRQTFYWEEDHQATGRYLDRLAASSLTVWNYCPRQTLEELFEMRKYAICVEKGKITTACR